MLEAAVRGFPDDKLGVHVVWAPMLGSDTEEAARKISRMFDDPRVTQYWDSKQLVGTRYATKTYPGYTDDAYESLKQSLPADHWWHEHDHRWKDQSDEASPLWDVAFLYEAGPVWSQPPPKEGDWTTEVALAMTDLMDRKPRTPKHDPDSSSRDPEPGCQRTSVQASVIASKFDELKSADIARVEEAIAAMKGVMRATFNEQSDLMTVLLDANGSASADKLVDYMQLAGYHAREADDVELEQALAAMQAGGAIVIRREASPDEQPVAAFPDTPAGRVGAAFIKAFNSGDTDKMRSYSETHRSKNALEARSVEERLEQYRELYGDWGKLDVHKIEAHDAQHVTVTVKPERGFSALAMTFQCEAEPPHKLDEIRIMPAFIEEPDSTGVDESAAGATADVTMLNESLKPLQDHFNANKGKHRFIAILSPT